MRTLRVRWATVAICLLLSTPVHAQLDVLSLSREEIREFLEEADVISARRIGRGVTNPWRLTLTDGRLTHDAAFQTIDERRAVMRFRDGRTELQFADSYHFNIAAYRLAELVGLGEMVPVSVPRMWRGERGALTWWVPDVLMDERERRRENARSPDPRTWAEEWYRMRVFTELVQDTDRNQGNLLITHDWRLRLIDFTRAFRVWGRLLKPEELDRCDRALFERLQALTLAQVREAAGRHLSGTESQAVIWRRDLLVAHFERLAAERGEARVFY